jgi:hypothetical protein
LTDTTPAESAPEAAVAPTETIEPTAPPAPPAAPVEAPFNVLAIVSIISAFLVSVVGIITGHIALSQIKKRGERGRGLALAGTVIGYFVTLAWIIGIAVLVAVTTFAAAAVNDAVNGDTDKLGVIGDAIGGPAGDCINFSQSVGDISTDLSDAMAAMFDDPATSGAIMHDIASTLQDSADSLEDESVRADASAIAQSADSLGVAIETGADPTDAANEFQTALTDFTATCS